MDDEDSVAGPAGPEPGGLETFGAGFEPFATFQKPIDFDNLLAAVRGALTV